MKLIKINTDHYVIVDDSEIKEGDWCINPITKLPFQVKTIERNRLVYPEGSKKITHSTQPFEKEKITNPTTQIVREAMEIASKDVRAPKVVRNGLVKPSVQLLPIQEIKELIGKVDVEKKAKEYVGWWDEHDDQDVKLFTTGYNQALEDNKDKKYTEEDVWKALSWGYHTAKDEEKGIKSLGYGTRFIQSLQPKTEWDVEFVDGKLKLI